MAVQHERRQPPKPRGIKPDRKLDGLVSSRKKVIVSAEILVRTSQLLTEFPQVPPSLLTIHFPIAQICAPYPHSKFNWILQLRDTYADHDPR